MTEDTLTDLERRIGHRFESTELLTTALTHSSYIHETEQDVESNERMEFLGDAVLDTVISHVLFDRLAGSDEGDLSKVRAALVNKTTLAGIARRLGIGPHVLLSRGEEITGGRDKASILSNVYEAVLAAVYLDGGMDAASEVIQTHFKQILEEALAGSEKYIDHKTRLQEICQARYQSLPDYHLLSASGPDHAKRFEMEVTVNGQSFGRGVGSSKKEAQQTAAKAAMEKFASEDREGES